MALGHSPQIVRDGLVLYLDAANLKSYPGSGTTWLDLTQIKNNRALVNGVTFLNEVQGTMSFDGVNDYTTIQIPTTTGSVNFWYYYNGTNTQKLLMGNGSSMLYNGGAAGVIHWYNNSGNYGYAINIGAVARWVNITLTYESNSSSKIYVNGKLGVSTTTYSISKGDGTYNVAGNFYTPQNCKIANIAVFNKPLSETEIQQNFNALRGRFGI